MTAAVTEALARTSRFGGAAALVERNALVARRIWPVMASGFLEPAFYLAALGFGLGSSLGPVTLADGSTVSYAEFLAPALLAVSAMNGALYDSTINILWKLRYQGFYRTLAPTPVTTPQIVLGEIAWAQLRGVAYAAGFLLLMLLTGTARSWWALLALPASVLVGTTFAAAGMAATTFMRSWRHVEPVTVAQLAMFLFSATFFPRSVVPEPAQLAVAVSPLYHANELMRGLCLGNVTGGLLAHGLYLVAMVPIGLAISTTRLDRLLTR